MFSIIFKDQTAAHDSGNCQPVTERNLTMAYDGTNRLIIESDQRNGGTPVNTSYFYDQADNRIRREITGGNEPDTTLYEIGDGFNGAGANQLKKLTRPGGQIVTYTYDPNGNRKTRSENGRTDHYQFDDRDRLHSTRLPILSLTGWIRQLNSGPHADRRLLLRIILFQPFPGAGVAFSVAVAPRTTAPKT